jgi:hypothetical protein
MITGISITLIPHRALLLDPAWVVLNAVDLSVGRAALHLKDGLQVLPGRIYNRVLAEQGPDKLLDHKAAAAKAQRWFQSRILVRPCDPPLYHRSDVQFERPCLPIQRVNFFIAGAQKGGTTALDGLLRGHPNIRMARAKEPHFFDNEAIEWMAPDYDAYHANFDFGEGDGPTMVGEATPIHSYWPPSLDRIIAYNSDARIVLCLRHPSFRAHSHWRMEVTRDADNLPFGEAIREVGRSRIVNGAHRVFSYVERGFYADQVRRIVKMFLCQNILFLRTDRLWSEPAVVLADICALLGVPPDDALAANARYHVPIETRALGPMLPNERQYLDDLFAADILATGRLTGLDLEDWLDPAYEEPMGQEQPAQLDSGR